MSPGKRSQFVSDAVTTASPGRLLVMLYDRLLLDLSRAEQAQLAGDHQVAGAQLRHAQDIVLELIATLDVDAWDGAPGLLSLYQYVLSELVRANVDHDAERTAACRQILEPLREAWREALLAVAGDAPGEGVPAAASPGHGVG